MFIAYHQEELGCRFPLQFVHRQVGQIQLQLGQLIFLIYRKEFVTFSRLRIQQKVPKQIKA